MDITNYVTGITANISNSNQPKSISNSEVGNAFIDLANLTKTNIEAVNGVVTGQTVSINTLSGLTSSLSASTLANSASITSLSATTLSIQTGLTATNTDVSGLFTNNIFRGSVTDSQLLGFLTDIQISGMTVNATDTVHLYYAWRGFVNTGVPTWVVAIGINGTRVATATLPNYVEPTPDAIGNIIDRLSLTPVGSYANNSGVTASVVVNWSKLTTGVNNTYDTTTLRAKAVISPNKYLPKITVSGSSVSLIASGITRGSSNVDAELTRLDTSNIFKGSNIDAPLLNFVQDIKISGMTVNATDNVHLYYAWRAFPNPTTPVWVVALGINGNRVANLTVNNYTEPTPDALGNIYDTWNLTPIGSYANNSGVTASVKINWAALTSGYSGSYFGANVTKALISPKAYGINKLPIAADLSPVQASVARIDKNDLFSGENIDSRLPNFLLDIKFSGNISVTSAQTPHVYYVWRNYTQSVTQQRWLFTIAIDENRICQYLVDNYVEPTPDANGNIFDTLTIPAFNGSGISAIAKVNWAAFASGSSINWAGSANYPKSVLAPKTYNKTLAGAGTNTTKVSLPSTTVPSNIYTVLNDIDLQNVATTLNPRPDLVRNYSQRLYVDRFLLGFPFDTDVRFDLTGTDKFPIASPRANDDDITGYNHPYPSTGITKSVIINGGTNYNNRTVTFNQISTRESTGANTMVGLMAIGDSTIQGLNTEIGVPDGYPHRSYAVIQEQFIKSKIDYLLSTGYTTSQVQSYLSTGASSAITTSDQNKYQYFSMGTSSAGSVIDTYTLNYKGITNPYQVQAEGRGGWGFYTYINKPLACARAQGSWDLMGLGNGTGTDYSGTTVQVKTYDRTAWNPSGLTDTSAMRSFVLTNYGFTGTTTASYVTWATGVGTNVDTLPASATTYYNAFYDATKTDTVTDSAGDVWQIRFSMKKYLARYRTMSDAGVRLASSASTLGSKVLNPSLYDIFLPTHIILQSCQNDGDIAHFGQLCKALSDGIKAEYTANSYGTPNIGFSIVDGAGTYFPKLYPEIDTYSKMNEFQRNVHNNNLGRLLIEITGETTNKVFVICNTHISPTAKSIVYRNANSPEFDFSGAEKDKYNVASRSSVGISAHQNAFGHRCWGIQDYAWVKYTLGL